MRTQIVCRALLKAMRQRNPQHFYQATQKGEGEGNIWLYILFLFLAEGTIDFSFLKFQAKRVKAKRQSYMGRLFYRKWGSTNYFDVTDCLRILLLWCAEAEIDAYWLVPHGLFGQISHRIQDCNPRGGPTHTCYPASPQHQLPIKKIPYRLGLQPDLIRACSHLRVHPF